MKMHFLYSFVRAALVALFFSNPVAAIELSRGDLSHSAYRLSLEKGGFIKGETGWLALELMPGEGWHTYWKNPGDSGAAPIFSWKTPEGVTIGNPVFPVPDFIPVGPLMNYGYDGPSTLLFPFHVDAAYSASIASISVAAEWLVCKVECVPQIVDWHFNVSEQEVDAAVNPSGKTFQAARSKLPEAAYWDSNLTISNNNSQLIVFSDVSDVEKIIQASFIPEAEGVLEYAAAQTWEWTPYGLTLNFAREEGQKAPNSGNGILRLLFVNGSVSAFELEPALKLNIRETSETQPQSLASTMPIWQAGLFALLGGLILNLMPCVFPVLSLKAFALVSANYKSLSERRMEGWAYTLGIWASFMLIVGVLVALRASGEAVGWGFQLQEPLFVGLLAILMVIVSLSLTGMFHLEFSFQGAGQSLAMKEGYAGSFFKGVLATLVATPCTAPLMAPAIGFAITQSLPVIILVFSLLAFGLALPFLALSYSDRLAKMMPRPGAWMEKVKQGLAFPMLLTAACDFSAKPTRLRFHGARSVPISCWKQRAPFVAARRPLATCAVAPVKCSSVPRPTIPM
ncbi:MAG: hypothetical protein KUG56_08270, partial [Kordiimonadaceae bacterium]|nr:hypothetical protein [Kordiimonadaceae bacterium]